MVTIADYCEIRTEQTHTLYDQNAEVYYHHVCIVSIVSMDLKSLHFSVDSIKSA
jgi:hypothetical protein